ncbi:MAG: U32 family peptidase [Candidatus Bathyarchaeia archaeon]
MRILAPVDKVEETRDIIEAGADELYCGVMSVEWLGQYPFAAVNRRPALNCNFTSFDELKKCVEIAHSYDVPVILTLNEHYYIWRQYPLLLRYVEKAVNAGVDAFLISDIALLLTLKELGTGAKLHISTGGATFNSETVKFYKDLGASGVTLDRHLTIEEIGGIIRNVNGVETTVFILNSRCANVDGLCTFMHFASNDPFYKNACMLNYGVQLSSVQHSEKEEIEEIAALTRQYVWNRFHIDDRPCGVCALYEFSQMGVTTVKIVGRGYPKDKKIRDVKFVYSMRELLDKASSKEQFRNIVRKLYRETYGCPCRIIMCYYPEVMF